MKCKWLLTPILILAITSASQAVTNRYPTTEQTEGSGTLVILDGHQFRNEYNPKLGSKLSGGYYDSIIAESKKIGCRGGDSIAEIVGGPSIVLNCFQRNNGEDIPSDKLYKLLKGKITSITFEGSHLCMASYRGGSKWITSGHCFDNNRPPYASYRILLDKPYEISVKLCDLDNCDLAVIEPIGAPTVPGSAVSYTDLSTISISSQLFVPGIEQSTPIPNNNIAGVDQVIMWSKIHNACIPYEVKKGCISYTCSTLSGFSGSPVFVVKNSGATLAGVHAGGQPGEACKDRNINSAVTADTIARIL
jgi:hypothetical protein